MPSYTYETPGSSVKDEIRFLLQDTRDEEWILSDDEIMYAYSKWFPLYGSVENVAASLAETIAARYAREASFSADGVSINLAQAAQQFRDLAVQLRAQHKSLFVGGIPDAGGVSPYEELPHDVKNFSFGTGMHDDHEVGPQDYGSRDPRFYDPERNPGT